MPGEFKSIAETVEKIPFVEWLWLLLGNISPMFVVRQTACGVWIVQPRVHATWSFHCARMLQHCVHTCAYFWVNV